MQKQGRTWDCAPVPHATVDELSLETFDTFRVLARKSSRLGSDILDETNYGLLQKLHLVEGKYLKRAGVLLFHPDPEKYFTGAYVKIGYFRTDAELLYHDEIQGDLFSQAQETIDLLLTKYLKAGITYEGIQRVEKLPVPEDALREAVLNALTHKDYSSGTPIQISVYPEKIMIWNPGTLPQNWTLLPPYTSELESVPE